MSTKLDLFTTPIYSFHVDPDLYNKQELIDIIIRNYNKNPERNKWRGDTTKIHHYYGDWDNPDFEPVPLEALSKVYGDLFYHFITDDLKMKPKVNFKVNFNYVNITIFKGKGEYLGTHDHTDTLSGIVFSTVHYIKIGKETPGLNFINPLLYQSYIYQPINFMARDLLDNKDVDNSVYYQNYDYLPKEDEIIIFPCYLKHQVKPLTKETDDYRIAIATNISIFSE